MKAITYDRFGPPEVLEETELPKPVPKDDEVLVRVRATTVTAGDWRCRSKIVPRGFGLVSGLVLGFGKPRQPILGSELAGEVEAVGSAVRRFAVGDRVFAFTGTRMGCYVEYKCIPEAGALAPAPAGLDDGEAAALSFGGTTALGFLRKGGVRAGDRVLVNGASGGVGTAAVQLARHLGAEVTGVCSTANLELVRSLGAERVVDYTVEDFTRSGERYDVVLDAAGTAPFARSKGSLNEGGRLLAVLGSLPGMVQAPWVSLTTDKKVVASVAKWGVDDLVFLAGLAGSGAFRPVIDRRYRFDEIVEAHRYVDTGRKRGNVVVTLDG